MIHYDVLCGDGYYRFACNTNPWNNQEGGLTTRTPSEVTCNSCLKKIPAEMGRGK